MKSALIFFSTILFSISVYANDQQINSANDSIFDWDPFWFDREEVASAAHEFADEAEHFHGAVESVNGYNHLASDAHELSESAEHFHESVEDGDSYWHLLGDYNRLQSDYRHLVRAWHHAHEAHHNWHLERDFREMDYAFRRLRNSLQGGHGGGHHTLPINSDDKNAQQE